MKTIVALAIVLFPASFTVAVSGSSSFQLSRISRVVVVVSDVDRAAAAWRDVFEVTVAGARREGSSRVAQVPLENLVVELVEPGPSGPRRDFLRRHGEGIASIGVDAKDPEAVAHALESRGGQRGDRRHDTIDIEFDSGMGGGIQVRRSPVRPDAVLPHRPDLTVRAIGHLMNDVERARTFWAGVVGVDVPPARDTRGVPFPADCGCDREAYIREVNIRLDNVGINLIQPVGGVSVWRRMIERHEGLQYLQFSVDGQQALDDRVATLERKGGVRTLGVPGAPYAYVDLRSRLGITLLLVRSAG